MKFFFTFFFAILFVSSFLAQEGQVYRQSGANMSIFVGIAPDDIDTEEGLVPNFGFFSENTIQNKSLSYGAVLELIKNNIGYRFSTRWSSINKTEERSSSNSDSFSSQFNKSVVSLTQNNLELALGLVKYFDTKDFVFSAGIELPFAFHTDHVPSLISESTFSFSNPFVSSEQEFLNVRDINMPNAVSVGLGASAGMHVKFARRMRVGLVYAPSLRYLKMKGKIKVVTRSENFVRDVNINGEVVIFEETQKIEQEIDINLVRRAQFIQRADIILSFEF